MRRTLIIIASVIVLIGIVAGVYFVFFSKDGATLTVGNPFGGIGSGDVTPGGGLPNTDATQSDAGTEIAPRFIKITDGPVAKGTVAMDILLPSPLSGTLVTTVVSSTSVASSTITTVSTTTSGSDTTPDTEVRFIDRASGNVYAYVAHARTLTRISNKTLPGVQVASWSADGSRAYAQFLSSANGTEDVSTYMLPANGAGGYVLESNLAEAKVAGSSTLFTLLSGTSGSVGSLANSDGSNARTLFSSTLSSLVVHPTTGDLFGYNKPSSQIDGYGFLINRTNGTFSRILGPLRGLSILPNASGSALIYSYVDSTGYHLRELDVASRTSIALPVATLTEKCVWAASGVSIYCAIPTAIGGNQPDLWYQGVISFTDRIWKIDLTQRVATLVVDPAQAANISIDAVALSVDRNEDILTFVDKQSGALYAYDL